MDNKSSEDWFKDLKTIISEPLKFKSKLAIGADAYASLRFKKKASEAWDVLASASAGTAGGVTASAVFAPNAFLSMVGFATPIGWVIAAGVLTGGAWYGISRYLKDSASNRTTVIPEFINTPMDVIALTIFDLLAPLSLTVANVDGHIHDSERDLIINYFVKEWGYDQMFVAQGILFTESRLTDFEIKEIAKTLAVFKKENPDCNYKSMSNEILEYLKNIIECDGRIDDREEKAIEEIQAIYEEVGKSFFSKTAKKGWKSIKNIPSNVIPKNIMAGKKDNIEKE